jgi:hypothetical protein
LASFAWFVLLANRVTGLAAITLPVFAVYALCLTHLIVRGVAGLTSFAAACGAFVLMVGSVNLPGYTEAVYRLYAALSVCGFSYVLLTMPTTLLGAVLGGLVGLACGGNLAYWGVQHGINFCGPAAFWLLLLFLAVRYWHAEMDEAAIQRDKEDPPDAVDFEPSDHDPDRQDKRRGSDDDG